MQTTTISNEKCTSKAALEVKITLSAYPEPPLPGAVAKSVERWPRVREIGALVPGRVKPMTYEIDILLLLPSLVLGINIIGLVSSVSG